MRQDCSQELTCQLHAFLYIPDIKLDPCRQTYKYWYRRRFGMLTITDLKNQILVIDHHIMTHNYNSMSCNKGWEDWADFLTQQFNYKGWSSNFLTTLERKNAATANVQTCGWSTSLIQKITSPHVQWWWFKNRAFKLKWRSTTAGPWLHPDMVWCVA